MNIQPSEIKPRMDVRVVRQVFEATVSETLTLNHIHDFSKDASGYTSRETQSAWVMFLVGFRARERCTDVLEMRTKGEA